MIRATKAAQSFPSAQTKRFMNPAGNTGVTMNATKTAAADAAKDAVSQDDYSSMLAQAQATEY